MIVVSAQRYYVPNFASLFCNLFTSILAELLRVFSFKFRTGAQVPFYLKGGETILTVLFGSSLERVQGSLSRERHSGPDSYKLLQVKLRKLKRLNRRYSIPLSAGPEVFYEQLSEVTALYPDLPISISIGGLSIFEGKNSQKKIWQLLLYISTLEPEWFFLIDILLERIVSRYWNRKTENLGKIGEETLQLLKVFGEPTVRKRYIRERYSKKKIDGNIGHGKDFFEHLTIRFFDASPIKQIQRKRGYNDHGSLKANHEYHGEHEIEGGENVETKREVQEILLEIYKESTKNYFEWLRKQVVRPEAIPKENSEIETTQKGLDEK